MKLVLLLMEGVEEVCVADPWEGRVEEVKRG